MWLSQPWKALVDALKIVKSIGLLNLFYNGVVVDLAFLETYALKALGIKNPRGIIEKLTANKIIRFAAYKSQFILFEGTDINIEREFEIKLENRQLPVIEQLDINGGLLFKKAVCRDSRQGVGYKVIEWTMSGVFYLRNVLQFVIDRLNQGPFSE